MKTLRHALSDSALRLLAAAGVACLLAAPAAAAELTGLWQTEPDRKDQTGLVEITPCGAALCGTLVQALSARGEPVESPNTGRRILSDVTARGSRGEGTVFVPVMNASFPVTLTASRDSLQLRACNGIGICQSQTWKRIR